MALSTEERSDIIEKLSAATVMEIADLVKELEEKWGVSAAAPVAVAAAAGVEAVAEDGTVEAVSVIDAAGFAIGVQWHPEYWVGSDAISDRIFEAFGDAVRAHRAQHAQAAE